MFYQTTPLGVLSSLVDRFKNDSKEEYREQNNKLYAKVPRKGFVVVAEDKTSGGARLFSGKIIMGSKRLQRSSSHNGVETDSDRTDER